MDADAARAREAATEFGATAFVSLDELLGEVDAVSVVTTTSAHAEVALAALERDRDVFIEKPLASSVEDAERIVTRARERARACSLDSDVRPCKAAEPKANQDVRWKSA